MSKAKFLVGALCVASVLVFQPAFAQPANDAPPMSSAPMMMMQTGAKSPPPPVNCADFHHNADGSWSPTHDVTVNGVTVGPDATFADGVTVAGFDVAAALDKQCAGR